MASKRKKSDWEILQEKDKADRLQREHDVHIRTGWLRVRDDAAVRLVVTSIAGIAVVRAEVLAERLYPGGKKLVTRQLKAVK